MNQYSYRLFLTVDEAGAKQLLKTDVISPIQLFPGLKILGWGMGVFHSVKEVRLIPSVNRDGRPSAPEDYLVEADLEQPEGIWQVTKDNLNQLQKNGWVLCRPEV